MFISSDTVVASTKGHSILWHKINRDRNTQKSLPEDPPNLSDLILCDKDGESRRSHGTGITEFLAYFPLLVNRVTDKLCLLHWYATAIDNFTLFYLFLPCWLYAVQRKSVQKTVFKKMVIMWYLWWQKDWMVLETLRKVLSVFTKIVLTDL